MGTKNVTDFIILYVGLLNFLKVEVKWKFHTEGYTDRKYARLVMTHVKESTLPAPQCLVFPKSVLFLIPKGSRYLDF